MRRTAIYSAMALVAIVGAWYLLWGRPLEHRVIMIKNSLRAEDDRLATYREALGRFENQMKDLRALNSAIDSGSVSFSGQDEIIALYSSLDSLCRRPEYQLEEITPSLQEMIRFLRQWSQSDSALSVPIRIKINGPFQPLAGLVKAVEGSRYFRRLDMCRMYGSDQLYPLCGLDLTFVAGLSHRMELFGHE